MTWDFRGAVRENCAVFWRVNEEFGGLSNMSNEFPLEVSGIPVNSSEALYQAMRYPHRPEWQQAIVEAASAVQAGMASKREGRRAETRKDWEDVRVLAMVWCVRVKLAQHFDRFYSELCATGDRPIVARSTYDRCWGVVLEEDGVLRGENMLGGVLTAIRNEARDCTEFGIQERLLTVVPPLMAEALLLGQPIEPIGPPSVP